MVSLVDPSTRDFLPVVLVVDRNLSLVEAMFVRPNNRESVNMFVVDQHVHDVSTNFITIALFDSLLDENLPVEFEIVDFAPSVFGDC